MPREAYHHGNLASEAISLALELVETDSGQQLSVRSLANSLGVAHRALYNHFGSRDGLLASLSARGFEMLASTVADQPDPAGFIRRYVGFALSRPELYALMMRQRHTTINEHEQLRLAVDGMISASAKILAPHLTDGESIRRAVMHVWMLIHGGVALHLSGMLRTRSDDDFIAELLAIAGLADGETASSETRPLKPG